MPAITYSGLLIIALVAVAVPVVLALVPRLPVPGAVLEVIAGILIGPSLLGWVHLNAPIQVLSDLGPGMLLFLAGLEIDIESLRGPLGRLVMTAAALAEVATIMMLSLLFSATSKTSAGRLASLAMFLALLAVIGLALGRVRNLAFLTGCSIGSRTAARSCASARPWPWPWPWPSPCSPAGSASPPSSARSRPGCWCGRST